MPTRASKKLAENIGKLFTVPRPFRDLFSTIWPTVDLNVFACKLKRRRV